MSVGREELFVKIPTVSARRLALAWVALIANRVRKEKLGYYFFSGY